MFVLINTPLQKSLVVVTVVLDVAVVVGDGDCGDCGAFVSVIIPVIVAIAVVVYIFIIIIVV